MIIKLSTAQFTEDTGMFYSPAFIQDTKDSFITVAVWLGSAGEASMQASIDGEEWVDVSGSTFSCNTAGLQTYVECHHELMYRIKTTVSPEKAWILA